MAIYSVYLPPEYKMVDPVEGFKLVSDAKSPLALIFPPFWLAWHRLWLELLAYAVIAIAIGLLAFWNPGTAVLYLSAIPGLYLLLEGNELIRRKMERDGWRFAGVVDSDTKENAEIRFLVGHTQQSEPVENIRPVGSEFARKEPGPTSVPAGLFPE